jgi:hypothetical protein
MPAKSSSVLQAMFIGVLARVPFEMHFHLQELGYLQGNIHLRKGMNLTNRDIDILKALALGVSSFQMLFHFLTKVFDYDISETALLRRLSMLYRDGYIARRKEPYRRRSGHFTLYALTRTSAGELAALGCSCESMRVGLPTTFFVRHEINVTAVLHTIHRDVTRARGKYSFTDSNVQKQNRRKGSRDPVPDLSVSLWIGQRRIDMNIEVDLGKVLISKMVRRIADQADKRLLIIMCKSKTRLRNLQKACFRTSFPGQGKVVFGLLDDFFKHGLHTDFIVITGETGRLTLDNN